MLQARAFTHVALTGMVILLRGIDHSVVLHVGYG